MSSRLCCRLGQVLGQWQSLWKQTSSLSMWKAEHGMRMKLRSDRSLHVTSLLPLKTDCKVVRRPTVVMATLSPSGMTTVSRSQGALSAGSPFSSTQLSWQCRSLEAPRRCPPTYVATSSSSSAARRRAGSVPVPLPTGAVPLLKTRRTPWLALRARSTKRPVFARRMELPR